MIGNIILDFLSYFDWINRAEGFVSTFINADWKGSYNRYGYAGIAKELLSSLTGRNTWTFAIPRDCGWTGWEIEKMLNRYGVKVFGRGINSRELRFKVKLRQANWAEYLLLRAGIPIASPPFNPHNWEYARRWNPGTRPPHRRASRKAASGVVDKLIDYIISLIP